MLPQEEAKFYMDSHTGLFDILFSEGRFETETLPECPATSAIHTLKFVLRGAYSPGAGLYDIRGKKEVDLSALQEYIAHGPGTKQITIPLVAPGGAVVTVDPDPNARGDGVSFAPHVALSSLASALYSFNFTTLSTFKAIVQKELIAKDPSLSNKKRAVCARPKLHAPLQTTSALHSCSSQPHAPRSGRRTRTRAGLAVCRRGRGTITTASWRRRTRRSPSSRAAPPPLQRATLA